MLYLFLTDSKIIGLRTEKSILGGEKISGCLLRKFPKGVIIDGIVKDIDKFKNELKEALNSAYPIPISEKQVSLVISDSHVFTKRLKISVNDKNEDVSQIILEEIKKILPYDPYELENFYQTINVSDKEKELYYTAMPKSTVSHLKDLFSSYPLKLEFIASNSLSIFNLFESVLTNNQVILYCHVENNNQSFILFDNDGPVKIIEEKTAVKSFFTKVKIVIDKLQEENNLKITTIILDGEEALEQNSQDLTDLLKVRVIKLKDIFAEIMQKHKIVFDSGGIQTEVFSSVLGLMLLSSSGAPPNFISEETKSHSEASVTERGENSAHEMAFKKSEESPSGARDLFNGEIIEKRQASLGQILSNRISIIVITVLLILAGIGIFIKRVNRIDMKIPFFTSPTLTPTPSPVPSLTPTPTIDLSLKRSDLKISIQNGTDKTGLAKETASFLEEKGYKIISKSNADKDDYQQTLVKVKKDKEKFLPHLRNDLKDKFDVSTSESLDEDSKEDMILILGRK